MRHRLADCRAQKVRAAAVMARFMERRVMVMNPRWHTTYW
jgi:hypothetical protein